MCFNCQKAYVIDITRVDLKRLNNYNHCHYISFNTIKPRYIDKVITFINLLLAKNNVLKFGFLIEKYTHCSPIQRIIEKTSMTDIVISCNSIRSSSHKDVKFDFLLPRKLTIKTMDTYYFTDLICKKNKIHDYFCLELESVTHWIKDLSIIDELNISKFESMGSLSQPDLFDNLKTLRVCIDSKYDDDMKIKIHQWITNIPHLSELYINREHVNWMNDQKPKKSLYADKVFICKTPGAWCFYDFIELFKSKNNRNIPRVVLHDTTTCEQKLANASDLQFFNSKRLLCLLPKTLRYSILHIYKTKRLEHMLDVKYKNML